MERGQFDAALTGLQSALGQRPTSPNASQARLLIARIYDRQGRVDAALAAYADLRATYPKDTASADALLRMADLVQQTKQPDRMKLARSYLDQIVANFPTTNVAPRALAQRAVIEEREDVKVTDPVLQRVVPAALVSYRQLTEAYPHTPRPKAAFIRLAQYYDDMKRYDLQAQALTGLGSYFPKTRHDAWWEAGEIFERRLRDVAKAKDAYSTRALDVAAVSRRAEEAGGAVVRRAELSGFGPCERTDALRPVEGAGLLAGCKPVGRGLAVVPLGSIPRPASPLLPGTSPLG